MRSFMFFYFITENYLKKGAIRSFWKDRIIIELNWLLNANYFLKISKLQRGWKFEKDAYVFDVEKPVEVSSFQTFFSHFFDHFISFNRLFILFSFSHYQRHIWIQFVLQIRPCFTRSNSKWLFDVVYLLQFSFLSLKFFLKIFKNLFAFQMH